MQTKQYDLSQVPDLLKCLSTNNMLFLRSHPQGQDQVRKWIYWSVRCVGESGSVEEENVCDGFQAEVSTKRLKKGSPKMKRGPSPMKTSHHTASICFWIASRYRSVERNCKTATLGGGTSKGIKEKLHPVWSLSSEVLHGTEKIQLKEERCKVNKDKV